MRQLTYDGARRGGASLAEWRRLATELRIAATVCRDPRVAGELAHRARVAGVRAATARPLATSRRAPAEPWPRR